MKADDCYIKQNFQREMRFNAWTSAAVLADADNLQAI